MQEAPQHEKIAVLKMNAFIDSPKLIVNGFGAWQGTLGEAFRLNKDRMASHLAFLCTSWDVDTGSSPLARGLHLAILGIPTVLESTTPRFPSLLT